jgi:mannosyltransferase
MSTATAYCQQRTGARVQHILWLLPIVVVYYCLAFYRIGYQSLWLDEVLSVLAANPEQSAYNVGIWRLGSRPLYFSLLHIWAQFGTSEIVLRSFSALVGGIGVFLVYLLGLRLFSQRAALIATALFASSPFLIWYSQEVRYITLLTTTSLFAMYAYHQALSKARVEWWLSYCCSLILAIAAFLTNVLIVVIHGLYVVFSRAGTKNFRILVGCQLLVFLLFVWWANDWQYRQLAGYWNRLFHELTLDKQELTSVPSGERFSRGGKREFHLAAIPYTFFALSAGFSLGPSVQELQMDRSMRAVVPHVPTVLSVGLVFGGLFVSGLIFLRRQGKNAILLGLWLWVPLIAACTVSALTHAAFNVRYVALILPAYIFILTAGIISFRSKLFQNAAIGSVLVINIVSLSNYYFNPHYARADTRSASQYLAQVVQAGDLILVVGSTTALRYYYKGGASIVSWNATSHEVSIVTDRLKQLGQNNDRLWLVETRRWEKDPAGNVRKAADGLYSFLQYRKFPGVDIYLYDLGCRPAAANSRKNPADSCVRLPRHSFVQPGNSNRTDRIRLRSLVDNQ